MRVTLTAEEFAEAFPFHFALDRAWKVVQFGRNLPRICPRIAVGCEADQALRLVRPEVPFGWEAVSRYTRTLFLIECRVSGVSLRGQMVMLAGGQEMLFLGSPWFTAADDLLASGLGLEDFAIHDPGTDMLLVMQAQNAAVAELKELAGRLTQQRTELRRTNRLLEIQNAELKAARDALARSEAEARLLGLVAARTNNGVVITDAEGRIVWVNEGFRRITGYHLDDVQGRTPGSVLQGPGTDPATVEFMRRRIRNQEGFTAEVLNYDRQGKPYWLSLEIQPVRDAQGILTHYLAIETDITERRRAEEALRAETEMLSTTLASIVDGVIAVDPEQRVQLLNPAAEALTGWSRERAQGRRLREVFDLRSQDGEPAPDLIRQSFDARQAVGDIHGTEPRWVLRSADGVFRWVVASAHPMLRDEAEIVGALVAFRDVSPEIEADEMKRDFVSAVSHELRTPLTSIRGFLSTLLADPDMPGSTRREFLQIVSDQAGRLTRLVEDILEISRIESGQVLLDSEPIDLVDMARASLAEITPLALKRDQRLDARVPSSRPVIVGDPDRVRSIFGNLLSNAVKFTPEGGTVSLHLEVDETSVCIAVRDTGIGIPPELQERIFQKFFRIRRPGTPVAGTGLGLSIVHSVVERMGGTIEVKSVPEQGTCFLVRLPLPPGGTATPGP